MDLKKLFKSFTKQNVLIIGDVMIDSYIHGTIERMSPEAPVPVLLVSDREERLGGAANVALNIQSLGANPIICAVTGVDEKSKTLETLLRENNLSTEGLLKIRNRKTTVKTRIISSSNQILRVDDETEKEISKAEEKIMLHNISSIIENKDIGVIIFQDYNKGCITASLIKNVIKLAEKKKIPVAVDPKKRNFLAYNGATLFKPNLKELLEGLKIKGLNPKNKKEIESAIEALRKKLEVETVLLTLSENGIYISGKKNKHHIPAHIRKIADVSGAGDTVISVAALCLGAKTDSRTLAELANLAGGLVCEKAGVVPIDKANFLEEAIRQK